MIGTLLRIYRTNLSRDRAAQALTFVLPLAFFSIFAGVFGSQGRSATSAVRVAVVNEDTTEASRRLLAGLLREKSLRVQITAPPRGEAPGAIRGTDSYEPLLDRARAEELVREGEVPVAIILPRGLGASLGRFDTAAAAVELLADAADPVAPEMVTGLLQKVGMMAMPDLMIRHGMDDFERYTAPLTPAQRQGLDRWLPQLRAQASGPGGGAAGDSIGSGAGEGRGFVTVVKRDLLGEHKKNPVVALLAAGIAVMFLLFSCAGAGGSLLDEVDSGTLERLLTSNVGMGRVLLGKWLHVALLGFAQVTLMFAWGQLVFRLDLLGHLPGFLIMTVFTAAAASAFGMVLATVSRSRPQLVAISNIVILSMSAVGGSMIPRFLMSEGVRKVGLFTFNAWAIDGYTKVFWREAPLVELWPQVAMLAAMALAFLALARQLARRWETA